MILVRGLIKSDTVGSGVCAKSSTRLIIGVEMDAAHEVVRFAVVEVTEVVGRRMLKRCFTMSISLSYSYTKDVIVLTLLRCPTKHTRKR